MKGFITSTLLLLALLLPGTASAYDFEVDGIYYFIYNNEAIVTSGNSWDWEYGSYSGDVTIPESVTYDGTTYSVTGISPSAFSNSNELTSVSIPKSVIIIEGTPFAGCSSLMSIVVDSGNPKYDSRDNCNALIETASNTLLAGCRGTIIPNSVTTIGKMAFHSCSGLTSVSIPNSVTTIDEMAFARCGDLTSVTIGNSVSTIGDWAFVSCRNLQSIIVDNGNPRYDSRNNCNAIIETASNTLLLGCIGTVIPSSVISIGYSAFYGSGLTSVDIPNSVTTIGQDAFQSCSSLTSVNIPNSVTTIGDYAFQSCSSLMSVDIPNSITTIGNGVFAWCYGLTSVNIPNSVTTIGNWAFGECGSLTNVNIPNSVTTIGNVAFSGCRLTSVNIPNSVTTIGNAAFSYCTSLTYVTIPNSVTTIGDEAFYYCIGLTDVYSYINNLSKVTCGDMMFYADGDGSDFDYSGRTLHVQHGTADAYQADENWYPYFGQIMEDLMPDVVPPGDVNSDLEVNIADINAVIDIILSGGSNALADVNGDGEVNIADVNAVTDVILGNHHALDITGTWYSEYFVDEYGKYDIPEQIAVQYTFNANKTGHYSYNTYLNGGIVECITELTWHLKGQRLYIWYYDGDYEELYCDIDENGYLLLSLYKSFVNYTAYRPVVSASAAIDRKAHRQGHEADAIKSVSRAIMERKTKD